jgi:hypothetical protein
MRTKLRIGPGSHRCTFPNLKACPEDLVSYTARFKCQTCSQKWATRRGARNNQDWYPIGTDSKRWRKRRWATLQEEAQA